MPYCCRLPNYFIYSDNKSQQLCTQKACFELYLSIGYSVILRSPFCVGKFRDGDEDHLNNKDRCLCITDFATAVDTILAATGNTT